MHAQRRPLRWLPILLAASVCASCSGSGPTKPEGPYWPPVTPRQPERLVLVAPDVADPSEWWRLNIFSRVPPGIYESESQRLRAEQFVAATNEVRAKYGLNPVVGLPQLDRVAQAHARDQAIRDYWWHMTPEGLWSRDRIAAAGVGTVSVGGENQGISEPGFYPPATVVARWENHAGHRELLLNPEVKFMGIGIYNYEPSAFEYYTQLLVDFD